MLSGKCYGELSVNDNSSTYSTDVKLDCKGRVNASGYKIPLATLQSYSGTSQISSGDEGTCILTADGEAKLLTTMFPSAGSALQPIYAANGTIQACQMFSSVDDGSGIPTVKSNQIDLPGIVNLFSSTEQSQMEATITVTGQQDDASFTFAAQDGNECTTKISCNGGFYQTSDARKKENLRELDLDKCYELIDKCQTVLFDYKDGAKDQMGMIAQEVEEFFPEIVSTDDKGFKSLDYAKLTVIVLRVLKDLIKKVNG